ncbi:MAG: exo-beta-1,3-glucanase (GH17 family) [Cyclobacteriaceae bacterium]|jgi:exo-beta-1,3-glucanase (GH17 family)
MKTQTYLFLLLIVMNVVSCQTLDKGGVVETTIQEVKDTKIQQLFAGTHKALCYSGFRSGQHPDRGEGAVNPSDDEILEDLTLMSNQLGTSLIRMYDCGENTESTLEMIKRNNLSIKVLLGVWLKAELSAHETCAWLTNPIPEGMLAANKATNLLEIARGIALAKQYPEIIAGVNVGNEALVEWNDHKVDVDTIICYVKHIQGSIDQPVTVADNYLWWAEQGTGLAKVVDFVSIHVYPIWEGVSIDEAIAFTLQNIKQVQDSLPTSNIVITEAGWATTASEFGDQASEANQIKYYQELMTWAKLNDMTTFFFEAFDEDWKGNPTNMMGAEKHWGLYKVDRTPKQVILEIAE